MQFTKVVLGLSVAAASVSARTLSNRQVAGVLSPVVPSANSASNGSCSSGTAMCCQTVQSGQEAKNTVALFGLNDLVGDLGFSCNQLPINAVGGAAAIGTECKATSVCCDGSEANGLIQTSCTPLSAN